MQIPNDSWNLIVAFYSPYVTYSVCTYIECIYRAWPQRAGTSIIFFICLCDDMEQSPLVLFGLRLRELRGQKGISQEKLALESGIARSYLGEVERGKRNIALLNIYKLAESLGVAPSELLKQPKIDTSKK